MKKNIVLYLFLAISICAYGSFNYYKLRIKNVSKIVLSEKQIYLNGNATILVGTHTKSNIEYRLIKNEKLNFEIESKDDTIFIYQMDEGKGLFSKLFEKNDDEYPTLEVLIPEKLNDFKIELIKNGDIFLKNIIKANQILMQVYGNGDIHGNEITASQKCKFLVHGNGDINLKKVKSGLLDCYVLGNGDIKLDQIDVKTLIGKVDGNGDIDFGSGTAEHIQVPNNKAGLITDKLKIGLN